SAKGATTLFVHANDAKQIAEVIRFKRAQDLDRVVLVGGVDSWMMADPLRENDIAVMVLRTHSVPRFAEDDIDLPYKLPKLLEDEGVEYCLQGEGRMPEMNTLQEYVRDQQNNAIGRGIAMELISREDVNLAKSMLESLTNDPSLAIREMAVEQAIGKAESLAETKADESIRIYREALTAARHPKQLSRIVAALGDLGDDATTADAFSLLVNWKSIAPFDNEGGIGYEAVYAPEEQFSASGSVDLAAKHAGKTGEIAWQDVSGSDDEGLVNLADAYNKEKGAVAYLFAEFDSPEAQQAQARLGCINANKVWVNGKEVMATEVYHSGSMLDQYVAPFDLKKGKNTVLLKICQNEQEESWAQRWEFQFRITDPTGKGLRSGK
ncbi:MAG: hypothetical protein ACPHL6_09340, partial [Rubripirellula sp.]